MNYTKSEIKQEQEANYFALCILMPKDIFLSEWKKLRDKNVDEEKQCIKLAELFQVPITACAVRMSELGNSLLTNNI